LRPPQRLEEIRDDRRAHQRDYRKAKAKSRKGLVS
jgi:hypothetical protein